MTEKERISFECGRSAAKTGLGFAPRFDDRMQELIQDVPGGPDRQSISAWYLGFVTQHAESGMILDAEMFDIVTEAFFPNAQEEATRCWAGYAREHIERTQDIYGPEFDKELALSCWLKSLVVEFYQVKQNHGDGIAEQVYNLAMNPSTWIYPSQMQQAAEHFTNGGDQEGIKEMLYNGELDGSPPVFQPLCDIPESHETHANTGWQTFGL